MAAAPAYPALARCAPAGARMLQPLHSRSKLLGSLPSSLGAATATAAAARLQPLTTGGPLSGSRRLFSASSASSPSPSSSSASPASAATKATATEATEAATKATEATKQPEEQTKSAEGGAKTQQSQQTDDAAAAAGKPPWWDGILPQAEQFEWKSTLKFSMALIFAMEVFRRATADSVSTIPVDKEEQKRLRAERRARNRAAEEALEAEDQQKATEQAKATEAKPAA
eukprot:CAMPEP_0206497302 /NCGR_PEP_ID=MMETSP0324_2-20121206/50088_1 /ASSEMBLY_ACC=CAM_ASM_000836 /TAXON_ID=2866 /ORGANISM="Crypthecodinium cohnii, Strain Seligo" /LENGTH=227 /DNA_ID=CAMNT_0053982813 /DNA_START=56 /DNA_END=739 /DNA_ORIENTATION=-